MDFIKSLSEKSKEIGYTNTGKVNVSDIEFDETLRALCESNACGKAGTNWCCPPGCGDYETLKNEILKFKSGLLVQKVYPLEDSFDIEGMQDAHTDFDETFYKTVDYVDEAYDKDYYSLKAGSCKLCDKCTYPDNPCIHEKRARPSLEACCINVYLLCKSCDVPYINGKNTVSYVALFLF